MLIAHLFSVHFWLHSEYLMIALCSVLLDTSQQVFIAADLKKLTPTALDEEIILLLQSLRSRQRDEGKGN